MLSALVPRLSQLSVRNVSMTPKLSSSVFTKKQKKMDPEIAKARETRRRRKLTREIREMMKHSKKPKPVTELTIDVKSARNIDQRYREPVVLTEAEIDQRAVISKAYNTSRNALVRDDIKWIQRSMQDQDNALKLLKLLSPDLYAEAVKLPDTIHIYSGKGPVLTPPLKNYRSPDGDHEDTTRTWE
ncbi:unnamed protein product [Bursaphelenchus xylophilus]|uniref:Large ribosomal subunit protein mL40 n=1 Tax=Bursaphelenchus xylophilus TaxID=6326 RepID=A0A1I7ST01_BURXY|nr:unnamed protein product [Bursaphelenchus xylophilus]CAG9108821.1 unnamed protein product [Bursaphelenchus xylophilus]